MFQTRLLIDSLIRGRDHLENLCKYEQMVEIIQLYKGEQYKEWTDKVDEDCQFNLSQPLLTRNEESVQFYYKCCSNCIYLLDMIWGATMQQ